MTSKEALKKELNNYSKDQLIDALLLSTAATGFVITKCKELYKNKPQGKKEAK